MRGHFTFSKLSLSIILTSCFISTSFAADTAPATTNAAPTKPGITAATFDIMKKNVENLGFKFSLDKENLDIIANQETVLASAPSLAEQDAIVKVTSADIKSNPMGVTVYAVGVSFGVTILSGEYATNPDLDKVHVSTYVVPVGSKDKQLCYSFDYTRKLYDGLDMDKVTVNDFIATAPNFTFTEWCKGILEKEDKASKAS